MNTAFSNIYLPINYSIALQTGSVITSQLQQPFSFSLYKISILQLKDTVQQTTQLQ